MKIQIRRVLISILATIFLLAILSLIISYNPSFVKRHIVEFLDNKIYNGLGYHLKVGSINGILFKNINFRDVTLTDDRGYQILSAGGIAISYNPVKLITDPYSIKEIHINSPKFNFIKGTEDSISPSGGEPHKLPEQHIKVDKFTVLDGEIKLNTGYLEDISLSAGLEYTPDTLSISFSEGRFEWKQKQLLLENIGGDLKKAGSIYYFSNFSVVLPGSNFEINGYIKNEGDKDFKLSVNSDSLDINLLVSQFPGLSDKIAGRARLEAVVQGNSTNFNFTSLLNGAIQGSKFSDVRIEGSFSNNIVTVDLIMGSLKGTSFSANGKLDLKGEYEGEISFDELNLKRFNLVKQSTKLSGNVQFSGSRFNPDSLSIYGFVMLRNSRFGDLFIQSLHGPFRLNSKKLVLDSALVMLPRSQLMIDGWLIFAEEVDFEAHYSSEDFSGISRMFNLPEISGQSEVYFHAFGDVNNPNIRGRLNLRDFGLRNLKFQLARGNFIIDNVLKQRKGDLFLKALNGNIGKNPVEEMSVFINFKRDSTIIKSFRIKEGDNVLIASGDVYNFRNFKIDTLMLSYEGSDMTNINPIIFDITEDGAILHNSMLRAGKGMVDVEGKIRKNNDFDVNIAFTDFPLEPISRISKIGKSFSGHLNGNFALYRLNNVAEVISNFSVDHGSYENLKFTEIGGSINYRNEYLEIPRLYITGSENWSVELSGGCRIGLPFISKREEIISGSDKLNFEIDIKNLNLSDFRNYNPLGMEVEGFTSGKIVISKVFEKPEISFDMNVKNARFDKARLDYVEFNAEYRDRRVEFERIYGRSENGEYSGYGYLPADLSFKRVAHRLLDEPMDLVFRCKTTDIDFITSYLSFIDRLTGDIDIELRITGTPYSPVREGYIIGRNGVATIPYLENLPVNVSMDLEMRDNVMEVKKLQGYLRKERRGNRISRLLSNSWNWILGIFGREPKRQESGKFAFTGKVDFESFFNPRLDLEFMGENIYFKSLLGDIEYLGDTEFKITGRDTVNIAGQINPIFLIIRTEFVGGEKVEIVEESRKRKFVTYNVHGVSPGNLFLRNSQADIEFEGDIWIIKEAGRDFNYSGELEVRKGKLFYYGDVFTIERGKISFDPFSFNPILDFSAYTKIGDEKIIVEMRGNLNKPMLELRSEPHNYGESDILELLTFNKRVGGVKTEAFVAPAQSVLSSYIEKELEKYGGQLSGFDTFDLKTGGALLEQLHPDSTEIILGRQISSNLYLTYQRRLSLINPKQRVGIEYKLNRNMSILGDVDENGLFHVNYIIRYNY